MNIKTIKFSLANLEIEYGFLNLPEAFSFALKFKSKDIQHMLMQRLI